MTMKQIVNSIREKNLTSSPKSSITTFIYDLIDSIVTFISSDGGGGAEHDIIFIDDAGKQHRSFQSMENSNSQSSFTQFC